MHGYLQHEVHVLELRQNIASKVQSEMTKQQREMLLRQQMRAIQEELGETDEAGAETELLRERFDKADLPEEVRKEAERELKRQLSRHAVRPLERVFHYDRELARHHPAAASGSYGSAELDRL